MKPKKEVKKLRIDSWERDRFIGVGSLLGILFLYLLCKLRNSYYNYFGRKQLFFILERNDYYL